MSRVTRVSEWTKNSQFRKYGTENAVIIIGGVKGPL